MKTSFRITAILPLLLLLPASCGEASNGSLFSDGGSTASTEESLVSTSPELELGYRADGSGHWQEYEGDVAHGRANFSPHAYSDWSIGEEGAERACSICGYLDSHSHEGLGEYILADGALCYVRSCPECGYHDEKSTYDEHQMDDAVAYESSSGTLSMQSIGSHILDEVINYPASLNGREYAIRITPPSVTSNNEATDHAVVYLPKEVRVASGISAITWNLDLYYGGTLEDFLNGQYTSWMYVVGQINLYLLQEDGRFSLLEDLRLPEGTEAFTSSNFAHTSIRSLVCNQELKTFSPLLTLNKHLTKIALNEGLKSLNLTTFDPPNVHHLTFPSTLEEVSGGPLHISRLYSLTIEEGCSAKIPENLFAYDYCRTLVAVFDHRGKAEKEYALPSGVRFTEENEADFRLIKDGDYVLYPINEEYCLLDYDGWDIAIDVPEAFHDGEKEISSYFVTSRFFLSHAINYRMEDDMEAWKSFNEPYASSITFHLSATRFEVDVDHKLYSYLRNLYFDMGKQEAEERLNPLLPLTSLFPLAAYYKDSPTGEYAPFYEYSPNL